MSRIRIPLVALIALAPVRAARADEAPPVGTVQTLPVVSVSLEVGSTEREVKRAVYSPPPGWYVRSHKVVVVNKHGTITYAVSTVPSGWNWKADERAASAGRSSAAGTVSTYKVSGGGSMSSARDSTAADYSAVASSHHLLVVEVAARGGGFLQNGSGVELTVLAEMVYLGR
jgi:hypothetical protein